MCRESKITMLRQAAFLQHVFCDLQTLPIKLLQMSCLIPTLAWQQLHCQSPIRQHCPLIPSSKVKHCGGAESRLREEQKGCKAYYRDGNAEPSFSAWTWPLHLLHRSSTFLWIPKHFLYNKSNTTSSLLPTFHESEREKQQLLADIYPFTGNQGWLYTHHRHSSSHLLMPAQSTGQWGMHLSLHWVKLNARHRQPVHSPSAVKTGTSEVDKYSSMH